MRLRNKYLPKELWKFCCRYSIRHDCSSVTVTKYQGAKWVSILFDVIIFMFANSMSRLRNARTSQVFLGYVTTSGKADVNDVIITCRSGGRAIVQSGANRVVCD